MRVFGLIGYPLGHSFSKKYFTDFFEKENLSDCAFENFEMENISSIRELAQKNSSLCGFNVTIPHKKSIIKYLDKLDSLASEVGAVNCVKIIRHNSNIELIGYNTDVIGFENSLKNMLHGLTPKALVLGSGGASAAVCVALKRLGIDYEVVSREKNNGYLIYSDLTQHVFLKFRLIINTTPLGMHPNINSLPNIPYQNIESGFFAYDLVYNPAQTAFLEKCRQKGATVKNGCQMLIGQAMASWEIYGK